MDSREDWTQGKGCQKGHNEGDLVKIGQELKDPRAVKVLEFQGLASLME